MAKTKTASSLVGVNVLISKSQATIRCTANGRRFEETGSLDDVLAKWQTFMDQLPADAQASAQTAMDLAKEAKR